MFGWKEIRRKRRNVRSTLGDSGTMAVLASYLLIFTVVTSFVTSQPVTNLQLPNKLNTSRTGEDRNKFLSSGNAAGNMTAVIPTSSQAPLTIRGKELNQFGGNKMEMEFPSSNNDNNDIPELTMRNKENTTESSSSTSSSTFYPRKIGGRRGPTSQDKVIVTDDVKGSSSRISNPKNDNSKGRLSPESDAKDDERRDDYDRKVNSASPKKIPLSTPQPMSEGKAETVEQGDASLHFNETVINNHANLAHTEVDSSDKDNKSYIQGGSDDSSTSKGSSRESLADNEYNDAPSSEEDLSDLSSSTLLMNKWIKTLVKLSQCQANCFEKLGNGSEFGETTNFRGAEQSSSESPTASVEVNKVPLLDSPLGAIKVTRGKSMKYRELSNCQEGCQRKFPISNSFGRKKVEADLLQKAPNKKMVQNDADYNNGGYNNRNENIETGPTSAKLENSDQKGNKNNHDPDDHHYFSYELGKNQLSLKSFKEEVVVTGVGAGGGERKRNKEVVKSSHSKSLMESSLSIQSKSLEEFPCEPLLKVEQVGLSGEDKNGAGISLSSSASFLLSWPKLSSSEEPVSGNNNKRPEGASAQVKDKKGIVPKKEEPDKNKEGGQRRTRGMDPITVFSIIVEKSWEKIRSDGTPDIYARRWKLIDQTVARTTTQIRFPMRNRWKERKGETSGASGALIQDKVGEEVIKKERNSTGIIGEDVETKESPPLSLDPPSKVTLRVLAVNGQGLMKVYYAQLNNSYYHLGGEMSGEPEPEPEKDHRNQTVADHTPTTHHQPISETTASLNQASDMDRAKVNFSPFNEKTGNQSGRKKGELLNIKGLVKEKGGDEGSDNENSNQILILLSKELNERGNKLRSQVKQKNTNSKGDSEIQENSIREDGGEDNFITSDLSSSKKEAKSKENWNLRTVSMVYQKFLVITQISWSFPDTNIDSEESLPDQKKVERRSKMGELLRKTMFPRLSPEFPNNTSKTSHFKLLTEKGETKKAHSSQTRCGGRGVDSGDVKLTFLLSWEIFGGGLRGNLVTDTCSASISLWPETAYIIQVGLISPRMNLTKPITIPTPSPTPSQADDHEHDIDDIDEISSDWRWREERRRQEAAVVTRRDNDDRRQGFFAESSSSTAPPSDPVLLPESITFPFNGEPKVTIKSERILVNTTRANSIGSSHLYNDDEPDDSGNNQDEIAPKKSSAIASQSNNNFSPKVSNMGGYWGERNFDIPERPPSTFQDSSFDDQVTRISGKMNVSPIIMNGKDLRGYENEARFGENDLPESTLSGGDKVWNDDGDEATDQDESLFARKLSHHNGGSSPLREDKKAKKSDDNFKFHNFLVNGFYQSLYKMSENTLELSNRYPNIVQIGSGGETGNSGGGGGATKHDKNASSKKQSNNNVLDAKTIPLLLGEFTHSTNGSRYVFDNDGSEENSGFRGKLYTLFVILVISFVVFLFVVAVVGFCVLTSSIKENYKYFVPKKVRVWTTVGQLLKGRSGSPEGENDSGGFRDSQEGSFYPRRLREEDDDEEEEFDPDEEVTTSVPPSDDEDAGVGLTPEYYCDCDCSLEASYLNDVKSLSTDETTNLIKDGEEASVELMACEISSSREVGVGYHHCRNSGNCDNNNPCYHTEPDGSTDNGENFIAEEERASSSDFAVHKPHCHFHHHHHPHSKKKKLDVRIDVTRNQNRSKTQQQQLIRQDGYY